MKLLAIDPGSEYSGYVIIDYNRKIIDCGKVDNYTMLEIVSQTHENTTCVMEKIACYGQAVGAYVFDTCTWSGRLLQRWYDVHQTEVHMILRREVKMCLCDKIVGINDAVIRRCLLDIYGEKGTKKAPGNTYGVSADAFAALGVAETFLQRREKSHVEQ
jgi:hypothetical protein